MRDHRLKLLVDFVLLGSAATTFASGAVLLVCFHVGPAAFETSALGLGRLTWLNLHRLPAIALAGALAIHLFIDRRAFLARLRAMRPGGRGRRVASEIALYATFLASVALGFVAWLGMEGSAPLFGPVPLGHLAGARHDAIDLHFLAGIPAALLVIHHVWHRWRWMERKTLGWLAGRRTRAVGEERHECSGV